MSSRDYFVKRSEERMKRMHDKATDCMEIVNKSFDDGIDRLKSEINHIIGSIDGKTQTEIQQHLLNTISYDKYKELLQIYSTTKDKVVKEYAKRLIIENVITYRVRRKEALIRAIEIEKLRQVDTQLKVVGKHLKNVYSSVLNELDAPKVSKEYLNEVLNHNWAGSNFSKRIWKNQTVLANTIQSNLLQAFSSGKSNRQIANELEEFTDIGRHVANRLVRTETSYMVNSADLESSKRRGIKAKKFEAHLDSRTSQICEKHNQRIIPIDKIKIGENAPPLHPYCRSFLSDLVEGFDYETEEELQELISDEYKDKKVVDLKEKVDNIIKSGVKIDLYKLTDEEYGYLMSRTYPKRKSSEIVSSVVLSNENIEIISNHYKKEIKSLIVLREERLQHILDGHSDIGDDVVNKIMNTLISPMYILEDFKNKDTLMFIRELDGNGLNVIVKLSFDEKLDNSIITAHRVSEKRLRRLLNKNKRIE